MQEPPCRHGFWTQSSMLVSQFIPVRIIVIFRSGEGENAKIYSFKEYSNYSMLWQLWSSQNLSINIKTLGLTGDFFLMRTESFFTSFFDFHICWCPHLSITAFVDVRICQSPHITIYNISVVFTGKTQHAVALVRVEAVDAVTAMLAWVGSALVDVGLAAFAPVAWQAVADELVHAVFALSAV